MKTKSDIRIEYQRIREKVENKELKDKFIFYNLTSLKDYIASDCVSIFYGVKDEINTLPIIKKMIKDGKKVVLPKVNGDTLDFYRIDNVDTDLTEGPFGLMEPIPDIESKTDPCYIDLFVVPGIAFDIYNERVGYGKGYYDRVLTTESVKVGICYHEQIINEGSIPSEPHDIKMDYIITDKGIF